MVRIITGLLCAAFVFLGFSGCTAKGTDAGFTISSTALRADGLLKKEYGASPGERDNTRSFPFSWSNLPAGTKSLALTFLDRSYGDYVHWIAVDIDPSLGSLPDDVSRIATFPQGVNDSNSSYGYVGPLPPARHQYELTVYALAATTGLEPRFMISDLQEAMTGKILGTATLQLPYEPFEE